MSSSNAKLIKMDFAPGIRRESTQYAEEGSWYDTDRVRFRAGRPENLRGYATKVSATFDGAARDLLTWADHDSQKRAIFGTPQKLYEHDQDRITDITPVSTSVTITSAFTVALSATTVTVTAAGHGRTTGDNVRFRDATGHLASTINADAGKTITVVDDDFYNFGAGVFASTTVISGGGQASAGPVTLSS